MSTSSDGQPKLVRNETVYPGTRNICFVNSVVQLLSKSGIKLFLLQELPDLVTKSPHDYEVSRELACIYTNQGEGPQSAARLRR